ncbi:30S ribosomal protein S8 [Candidatus Parcubacteria bacterium]|nr:MAG: 30S ribosomal protein S8 [Candidatus Parcubacteria bacterium]
MTDPIADMLTRIRNAVAVKKPEIVLPYSNLKFNLAKILEKESYISKVEKITNGKFDELRIELKYTNHGPAIRHIKRLSKPGQRIYAAGNELPHVLNGYGLAIISTSKGIMTNKEAKSQNIGGELMCEIW